MRILGSSPWGIATGLLHSGPIVLISTVDVVSDAIGLLTARSYAIMFALVVLRAFVRCHQKVFPTKAL
jgi:hypothetical protein